MTHPASDGPLSRVHTMALSHEIGDRLRSSLDRDAAKLPLDLLRLLNRFHDQK